MTIFAFHETAISIYNRQRKVTVLLIQRRPIMDAAVAAPSQFKQSSRKGKKAWRKNVDITEVQEGLDNVREEVIAG